MEPERKCPVCRASLPGDPQWLGRCCELCSQARKNELKERERLAEQVGQKSCSEDYDTNTSDSLRGGRVFFRGIPALRYDVKHYGTEK
tara:strand:- start:1 stop:264 length:264 start_codon:yes stop_codon:yes gene_type:complete